MADRTISVRLKAEAGQYMATMRAAGKATKDLEGAHAGLSKALDREADAHGKLSLAQQRLTDMERRGTATALQLAEAREKVTAATRRYEAAQENTRQAATRYSEAVKKASDDNGRFGDSLRNVDKIAQRTQLSFKLLVGALAAGLPAASTLAFGAAVAGVAAGFTALGAVALRNNEQVRQSFIGLKNELNDGLTADAQVMVDSLVDGADLISDRYQALRPNMRAAFEGASQQVEPLIDSVFDLATSALPGMINMLHSAGPAMSGFNDFTTKTGLGLSDLFNTIANGSEDAGKGMSNLGNLLQGTLSETGGLLGHLNKAWADHGDQISNAVVKIIGTLSDLTGSALPLIASTAGGALDMLSGLLDAIAPMAPVLGPAIAAWLSLAGAMKAISGVQSVLGRVSEGVTTFAGSLEKGSRRANAFKVAGLAAVLGLTALSAASRTSSGDVAKMTDDLDRFAESGRLSGEAARVLGDNFQNVSESLDMLGSGKGFDSVMTGINKFVEAIPLVGDVAAALDGSVTDAEQTLRDSDSALSSQVGAGNFKAAQEAVAAAAKQAGISVGELRDRLPQYDAALKAAAESQRQLGTSAIQSTPGIKEIEEALTTLQDKTASTTDKVDALNSAFKELFGGELQLEEARAAFEESLDAIAESINTAKQSGSDWESQLLNANGTINLATEAGRGLSKNLIKQGEDYRALAQTAYDSALKQGKSQKEATRAASVAVNSRRAQFISEMRQLGLNEDQARQLANRYLKMPKTVRTAITNPGMLNALSQASQLLNTYNSFPRYIQTTITAIMPGASTMLTAARLMTGQYADGGLIQGYANGGSIRRYDSGGAFQDHPEGRLRGPGGPRSDSILARVSNGEFVSTGMSTQRNLAALEAGNRGAQLIAVNPGAYANGGSVGWNSIVRGGPMAGAGAGSTVVNFNFPNYVGNRSELLTVVRKHIADRFGGDVNKALGNSKGNR